MTTNLAADGPRGSARAGTSGAWRRVRPNRVHGALIAARGEQLDRLCAVAARMRTAGPVDGHRHILAEGPDPSHPAAPRPIPPPHLRPDAGPGRAAGRGVRPGAGRRTPGKRPGRAIRGERRRRDGRRHRLRDAPVLRRLRRGGATADGQALNCLFVVDESASAACSGAGHRTPRSPTTGGPPVGQARRPVRPCCRSSAATALSGHGGDDPAFLQPDRPMSAIGD